MHKSKKSNSYRPMPDINGLFDQLSRNLAFPIIYYVGGEIVTDTETLKIGKKSMTTIVVAQLLASIRSSCGTLSYLANSPAEVSKSECLFIARAIIETSINAAFILATGDAIARRAVEHSVVKGYKRNDRNVGGFSLKRKLFDVVPQDLEKLLNEFSNKKGYIKDWTDTKVPERIEKIREVFGQKLTSLLFASYISVYSDASEMIHGSLAGAQIKCGAISFGEFDHSILTKDKFGLIENNHAQNATYGAFYSLLAISKIIAKNEQITSYQTDIDEVYETFKSLFADDLK